jgi:hypothetical protein
MEISEAKIVVGDSVVNDQMLAQSYPKAALGADGTDFPR